MAVFNIDGTSVSRAYDINGTSVSRAYNINGDTIYTQGAPVIDYDAYLLDARVYCAVNMINLQAFDICNDVIFQLRSNPDGTITTIDKNTQTIITQDIVAGTGHGNSAMFSSEYYDANDEYPLLFALTRGPSIIANRVTNTTSETAYTYPLSQSDAGYASGFGLDEDNGLLYVVGYTVNDWYDSHDGANKVILSKWNISNGTPVFISKIERDFIYCMQGCTFHDGMLWVASGTNKMDQYIYALDVSTAEILHSVNTTLQREIEGCTFISDTELVFGMQGGTYRKIVFEVT